MKIIVDENISFGEEAFSTLGEVVLLHGRKIDNEKIKDADALIVRSITDVNRNLLEGTGIKFVGTATIGTDHIDEMYLREKGIRFASAAGCNSHAVKEYVLSSLGYILKKKNLSGSSITVGIVGCGNIGSKLASVFKTMGVEIVLNDPPLKRITGSSDYRSLNEALECDAVTFHVPLIKEGEDRTVHLADNKRIMKMKKGTVLINSSRGPVVDNDALLRRLTESNDITAVLDVWENEPYIKRELLEKTEIATPHIAGYSLEGKVNGTKIIYDALCEFREEDPVWEPVLEQPEDNELRPGDFKDRWELISGLFSQTYRAEEDSRILKETAGLSINDRAVAFDRMRKEYQMRRELLNYSVKKEEAKNEAALLKELRINLI